MAGLVSCIFRADGGTGAGMDSHLATGPAVVRQVVHALLFRPQIGLRVECLSEASRHRLLPGYRTAGSHPTLHRVRKQHLHLDHPGHRSGADPPTGVTRPAAGGGDTGCRCHDAASPQGSSGALACPRFFCSRTVPQDEPRRGGQLPKARPELSARISGLAIDRQAAGNPGSTSCGNAGCVVVRTEMGSAARVNPPRWLQAAACG